MACATPADVILWSTIASRSDVGLEGGQVDARFYERSLQVIETKLGGSNEDVSKYLFVGVAALEGLCPKVIDLLPPFQQKI